jgi:hypothetical protein
LYPSLCCSVYVRILMNWILEINKLVFAMYITFIAPLILVLSSLYMVLVIIWITCFAVKPVNLLAGDKINFLRV